MATFINSGKSHFKVTSMQDPSPLISYHADTWTPAYKNLASHTHEMRASVIMKTSDITSWHMGTNDSFCCLQEIWTYSIGFYFHFLSSWFSFFNKGVFCLWVPRGWSNLLNWSDYFSTVSISEWMPQQIYNWQERFFCLTGTHILSSSFMIILVSIQCLQSAVELQPYGLNCKCVWGCVCVCEWETQHRKSSILNTDAFFYIYTYMYIQIMQSCSLGIWTVAWFLSPCRPQPRIIYFHNTRYFSSCCPLLCSQNESFRWQKFN